MWNSLNDNDILDFALLWDPLGGPAPENVATAFSIEMSEYHHRLRGAARSQLDRLEEGTASPERIYRMSGLVALARDPRKREGIGRRIVSRALGDNSDRQTAYLALN
jgi:hypothetical protein